MSRKSKTSIRTAGTVLNVTGIFVGAVGGIILGAVASEEPSYASADGIAAGAGLGFGVALTALGGLSILIGIPVWIAGDD